MRLIYHLAIVALVLTTPRWADAQAQLPSVVEMRVPKAPTVASGNGASFLVHELHVTNLRKDGRRSRRRHSPTADTLPAGAAHDPPRLGAGVPPVADHGHPVHEHVAHAH